MEIYYAYEYSPIAYIDMANRFTVDLFFFYFRILPEDAKEELFKIITEFAAKGLKTTSLQCKEYGQAVKEEVMKTYGTLDYMGLRSKKK